MKAGLNMKSSCRLALVALDWQWLWYDGPIRGAQPQFKVSDHENLLVFEIPKEVQEKKVKNVTLTLVQSIPKFAKDGAVRFFLAPDLDAAGDLKFDLTSVEGMGSQIKSLHSLGSGDFKKIETGKTESFSLTVDDAARGQIAKGGKLCLVIVPADAAVAATYFGVSENDKEKSPRLVFGLP